MKCPKCHSENPEGTFYCGKCATPLPSSKDISVSQTETLQTPIQELTTGSTFANRYQIIEELGKGGMGKVYKVFDQEVQARMALKLIKPEVSADRNTIDRFRNELKIARDISHKNICRMYDLGREAGNYFITMEYVSGEDLKSFIRRARQLVVGTAIFIAKQVCEGLAEAHRLGVVHRDLKPGNIMIDKEGNAKIMDFGIARSISVKGITGAGVMIGTPEYMSPEQVEGKEVDHRSDFYSLGIILYEMLTGQVPFEGDTPFTVGVKQKSEIPKDPRGLNAQIPQDLSHLILRCLEKDKERRYQNADELRANLEKIEKGIPTAERPIPKRKTVTSKPITLTISRKKFFVPLSIIIGIAIIGIGLWRFLPKRHIALPPTGKPTLAILYFENNSGDQNLEFWKTGLTGLLITKLAQSKYLNVLSDDRVYGILKKLNLLEARKYSTEDLTKVASEGQAAYTLSGSLMKAGENIIINLTLQMPQTGKVISLIPVECKDEKEIMSKVEEVATKIKADLNLSSEQISNDIDKETGKITTASPEAYRYYRESRELGNKGEDSKALQLMLKAVEIDPEFAMAYRDLGITYGNLGYFDKAGEYIKKAFEHRDRLSDKERYLIEGDFYSRSEDTFQNAIEAYKKVIELYPDVWMSYNNLGVIYNGLEEWDEAEKMFKALVDRKEENVYPFINLAYVYQAKGMFDKAMATLELYQNSFGDAAWIHQSIAANHFFQGKLDLALAELEKAFLLKPDDIYLVRDRGNYYYISGKFLEAEREYRNLLNMNQTSAQYEGMRNLAALYLTQGKFEKAKEHLRLALAFAEKANEKGWITWLHLYKGWTHFLLGEEQQALKEYELGRETALAANLSFYPRFCLIWKGFLYAKNKSFGEAGKLATQYKEKNEKTMYKRGIKYYDYLLGSIELENGNLSKAIRYLDEGLALESFGGLGKDAVALGSLASAYYEAKNLDQAKENYEKIISLTVGRLWFGYQYARSFYMLGKIAEQQGDKTKAIECFSKFLDLWKDADPGRPEVEDARKRLAGLKME
jgi:serine/threonine protein kinase/Flp pilus assembly protein TadD